MDQQDAAPGGFQASHDHRSCKAEQALPGVSQKLLTAPLRVLEADGLVQERTNGSASRECQA